jgi:uncharacterized protein YndB with AHSA1/START domain
MIDVTISTDIARPVEDVYAYVTDPSKLPTWQTNTVSVDQEDDGPLRVGSRLREVHRGPRGKELASLVEVSELEPERAFALRMLEGPLPIHAQIAFAPSATGTRIDFRAHGEPSGAMRLAQPLLRVALRRQFAGHCATLKRVMEDQSPGQGA